MRCPQCGLQNPVTANICGKCSGPLVSPGRHAAVQRARQVWIEKLIDLSRRNRLLYFRETKTGSLDLTAAEPEALAKLLQGTSVGLSDLIPAADETSISSRAKEIKRTARVNLEERGLETLFAAFGFASWPATDGGRATEAPIVLAPLAIEKQGRESRALRFKLNGELQLNAVMLFSLAREHSCQIDPALLLPPNDGSQDPPPAVDLATIYENLRRAASKVKGFAISPRAALSNFSYHKMSMVKDLQDHLDQLEGHDLIAALAGDIAARQTIGLGNDIDPRELDRVPPNNEFLILDADSSQQTAISGALALKNGVIQGPPGTGKSQTIANLIAEFAARGKKVLFVAEKRAALEVVRDRLQNNGLGHLALDLHRTAFTRQSVTAQFKETLDLIGDTASVSESELFQRFADRRNELRAHVERMHAPQKFSGLSPYQLQGHLLHIPVDEQSGVRWRDAELDRLTKSVLEEAQDLLSELDGLSGLFLRTDPSQWTGVRFPNGTLVQQTLDALRDLIDERFPKLAQHLAEVLAVSSIDQPRTLGDVSCLISIQQKINQTLEDFVPAVFEQNLDALKQDLSPAISPFRSLFSWCFDSKYRRALHTARALCRNGKMHRSDLVTAVGVAAEQLKAWKGGSAGSLPVQVDLAPCAEALEQAAEKLTFLGAILGRSDLADLPMPEVLSLATVLANDSATARWLPRLTEIEDRMTELGIDRFVKELRNSRPAAPKWSQLLEHAWLASCHDRVLIENPRLVTFNGTNHQRIRDEFSRLDSARLALAIKRVRRSHAEHALAVMNEFPAQEVFVRQEINRRRPTPFRKMLARAPDVLTALRPCWFASPLSVSELMPAARRYFDVVLFDEASQILPEDAIPALMRASTAIVAGDQNQLPPTTFFDPSGLIGDDPDEASASQDYKSLLDQMIGVVPRPWLLQWHYRSLDEALIAFSNHYIYGDRLITFPGVGGPPAISLVPVTNVAEQVGQEESSSEEIRQVVALVLKHASERPNETLGVIAMGIKHAQRVEAALDQAVSSHPELTEFFVEDKKERFFVKNLERVQGDERDAIILTVGYGKDRSGQLLYYFGPLNNKGGERRLNVAITRARRRMTVVSTFDDRDMDAERTKGRGVDLLRLFLEYARNQGKRFGDAGQSAFAQNSFEADVHDALRARGIDLLPQYGVSNYRIDFVAKHPIQPGRLVLAIECDGASYHSAYTVRDRDRLRQQHLEALGWSFHRIWSTDWFTRREQEIERAIAAFNAAVKRADRGDRTGGTVDTNASPAIAPGTQQLRDETKVAKADSGRGPRPVAQRPNIDQYSEPDLLRLIEWLEADGRLRTDQELDNELFMTLGFKRRGARIDDAIRKAIAKRRWRLQKQDRSVHS